MLRISETCVACGVACEGGAECDNAVNPARQGSGVNGAQRGGAAMQQVKAGSG